MSDAAAATRQAAIANVNAAWRPSWNGPEIRLGKNDGPVSAAWSWAERAWSEPDPRRCWIGL
jgi:hypothetical protein